MSWLVACLVAGAEVGALLLPWLIRNPTRGPRLSLGQTLRFTRVRVMLPVSFVGWTVLIHGATYPWAMAVLVPLSVAWVLLIRLRSLIYPMGDG